MSTNASDSQKHSIFFSCCFVLALAVEGLAPKSIYSVYIVACRSRYIFIERSRILGQYCARHTQKLIRLLGFLLNAEKTSSAQFSSSISETEPFQDWSWHFIWLFFLRQWMLLFKLAAHGFWDKTKLFNNDDRHRNGKFSIINYINEG